MVYRERVRRDLSWSLMEVRIELAEMRELIEEEKRQLERLRDVCERREWVYRWGVV